MKYLAYNYSPYLLTSAGFIFGVFGLLLAMYGESSLNINRSWLGWAVFIPLQTVFGLICGILIRKLHRGACHDHLTGLWNRRYFCERLRFETRRQSRTKSPLCIALIDIDDFKDVNDRYGHLAGDKLLERLSTIFDKNIRSIDTVARWGGDEFAIIFPGTDINAARTVAERIRRIIENNKTMYRTTVSIGLISVPKKINIDQLIFTVDQAMYKAKENKNLIATYRC